MTGRLGEEVPVTEREGVRRSPMEVRRREATSLSLKGDSRYKAEHTEDAHPGIDTRGLHKQCRLIVWSGYQKARSVQPLPS